MEETAASRPQKSRKGAEGARNGHWKRNGTCPLLRVKLTRRSGQGGLCRKLEPSGCEGSRERSWNYMWGPVRGFLFMKDTGMYLHW